MGGRRVLALVALSVALFASCGGGGSGGGPTTPGPGITFLPSSAPGSNTIHLVVQSVSANQLILELRGNDVNDIFAAAFDLRFPAAALQFVSAGTGDDFTEGGDFPVQLLITEEPSGNLVVGLSRTGKDLRGFTGSGVLMILEFNAIASGGGDLSFLRTQVVDRNGIVDAGITFLGGSLQVVL